MNKRLVWNFEINPDIPFQQSTITNVELNEARWEARFFWPEDNIIILNGLSPDFLNLSGYDIKHKNDIYYLLPKADYNLKIRKNELYYKPILMKKSKAIAFGKKIKLSEQDKDSKLLGCEEKSVSSLLEDIKRHGKTIEINKEAISYKFLTSPATKLELSRLKVENKIYFSASIESYSRELVEITTKQLLGSVNTSDMLNFLKGCKNLICIIF